MDGSIVGSKCKGLYVCHITATFNVNETFLLLNTHAATFPCVW